MSWDSFRWLSWVSFEFLFIHHYSIYARSTLVQTYFLKWLVSSICIIKGISITIWDSDVIQVLTKVQDLSNFHITSSSFVNFKEISFKFPIHYIFVGNLQSKFQIWNASYKYFVYKKERNVCSSSSFASSSSNSSSLLAMTFSSPFNHAFSIQLSFDHETRKRERVSKPSKFKWNSKQELIVKIECSFHH